MEKGTSKKERIVGAIFRFRVEEASNKERRRAKISPGGDILHFH